MKNRKMIAALAMALLLCFSASMAIAQAPADKPAPQGGQPYKMSPEERAKFTPIFQAHQDKMDPLRDSMWAKKMEYKALAKNPNTTPETIEGLVNDMVKIRVQMRAERKTFMAELEKAGLKAPFFQGMKGYCGGMMGGQGMMGGGMMKDGHGRGPWGHDREFEGHSGQERRGHDW